MRIREKRPEEIPKAASPDETKCHVRRVKILEIHINFEGKFCYCGCSGATLSKTAVLQTATVYKGKLPKPTPFFFFFFLIPWCPLLVYTVQGIFFSPLKNLIIKIQ